MRRGALVIMFASLLTLSVSRITPAEVVVRRDGTRIVGKCHLSGRKLVLRRGLTTRYIPLANVARVELHPQEAHAFEALRETHARGGATGQYKLGKWLDDHLQFERADGFYRKAIALNANHAPSRRALGYRKRGRAWVPDPQKQLERASKTIGPGAAEACVGLGKGYAAEGNDKAAAKAFRYALVADPAHREALALFQPFLAKHKLHNVYRRPLAGRTLAVSGHNHRTTAYMYHALDLVKPDAAGRTVSGDPRRLDSYHTFNAAVFAAADGEVFSVIDRYPDMPIGRAGGFLQANSVAVKHAGGEFTLYAHLKRGSAAVRKGQRVKAGQLLGRVGNSGSTMTPHLHFCIYDGDGISLPITFTEPKSAPQK